VKSSNSVHILIAKPTAYGVMTGLEICVSSWLSSIKVIPHFYHGVCYKSSNCLSNCLSFSFTSSGQDHNIIDQRRSWSATLPDVNLLAFNPTWRQPRNLASTLIISTILQSTLLWKLDSSHVELSY